MRPPVNRVPRAGAVAVLLALLAGCGGGDGCGSAVEADCSSQIRVDGLTYTGYSSSDRAVTKHGRADQADCHDEGCDAAGSVFGDDPRQVTTWRFRGYPPEEVLGVRVGKGPVAVFVADSLSDAERDRVLRELG